MKIKNKFYKNKLVDLDEVKRLIDVLHNNEAKSIMSLLPKDALDALMQYKDSLFDKVEGGELIKEDAFAKFKKARQDAFEQNPESVVAIHKKGTKEVLIYDLTLDDLLSIAEQTTEGAMSDEELKSIEAEAKAQQVKAEINQATQAKIFEMMGADNKQDCIINEINELGKAIRMIGYKQVTGRNLPNAVETLTAINAQQENIKEIIKAGRKKKAEL